MKIKTLILVASLLVAPLGAISQDARAQLGALSQAFTDVAVEASPAVVFIDVQGRAETNPPAGIDPLGDELLSSFFGLSPQSLQPPPRRGWPLVALGTGFVVTSDGYILTNNHVVGDANRIKVTTTDGSQYDAKLVGTDKKTDLAVIKIDGHDLPCLNLADSDDIQIGEWVVAIGQPFGLETTVTTGIVSAKGRSQLGISEFEDWIQTDAAINPGNSGGPLLNLSGEVVGINSAIFTMSGGHMGLGFAIPSNIARQVMDQIMASGKVTRGYIGVVLQSLDARLGAAFNLSRPEGVLVAEVRKNTPASKAGLEHGDIITAMNGTAVESVGELRNKIAHTTPGQKINFAVTRNGASKKIAVTVDTHPNSKKSQSTAMKRLGVKVKQLTAAYAEEQGIPFEPGVVVSSVKEGSLAWQGGIRKGTIIIRINAQWVTTCDEFTDAIDRSAKVYNRALLLVRQSEGAHFVAIDFI